jgi:Flp pilus assembly protein TadD
VSTIEAMKNMGMEKWKEANEHLNKALSLDPHNAELKQMHDIVKAKL